MAKTSKFNGNSWIISDSFDEPLQKWKINADQPVKWTSGTNWGNFRIATKRTRHSAQLADRIATNAEVVEKLVDVIKSLTHKPDTADEIDKLLDISKELLANNAQLRSQVEEALQDIPD